VQIGLVFFVVEAAEDALFFRRRLREQSKGLVGVAGKDYRIKVVFGGGAKHAGLRGSAFDPNCAGLQLNLVAHFREEFAHVKLIPYLYG
jgi:hypothetical protein